MAYPSLRTALLAAADKGVELELRNRPDLEGLALRWVGQGRGVWPDFAVSDGALVAWIGGRLTSSEPHALEAVRAADLLLTCACIQGDSGAIRVLMDGYLGPVRHLFMRKLRNSDLAEETSQMLATELLVSADDREPKLSSYRGRGPLRGWLNAVAINKALRVAESVARSPLEGDEESLLVAASTEHDPELRELKASSRDALVLAFRGAMADLPDRDKTLLRQHYVDAVPVEKLARLHRVHRVTMSRRLAKARDIALETTRQRLAQRFALGDTECDSLIRFARSQLEITRQLLA